MRSAFTKHAGQQLFDIGHALTGSFGLSIGASCTPVPNAIVAKLENLLLVYSISKDSSVLLHLALKACYPSPPPFPLLHIDSTWEFRDNYVRQELGLDVIADINQEGVRAGLNPFDHGSTV